MIFHYKHAEWFEQTEKPVLSAQDAIILWGAGKIGTVVAHSLEKRNLDFLAFVDSAKDKQGTVFYGHKVISPQKLFQDYKDAKVIVSCAFPSVIDELKANGMENVYDPHSLLLTVDFEGYKGNMTFEYAARLTENALRNYAMYYGRGLFIERLLFAITDKCSLKCVNCDGYMPYHVNPCNDDMAMIIESYEKVIAVCGYVETIDILGGEPLVHPDIAQIVEYFVKDPRCGRVMIITNGTIVPDERLTAILKTPKCTVRISDYGKHSRNKEKIVELAEKENIRIEITNYQYWDRIPLIQEVNESEKELDIKYAACTTNVFYVKHGKAFHCSFCCALSGLEENLIPHFERNYVELIHDKDENIAANIERFAWQIHNRKHIDACKYCPGSHCIQFEEKVPVAEQAEEDLPLPIDNLYKGGKRICTWQT